MHTLRDRLSPSGVNNCMGLPHFMQKLLAATWGCVKGFDPASGWAVAVVLVAKCWCQAIAAAVALLGPTKAVDIVLLNFKIAMVIAIVSGIPQIRRYNILHFPPRVYTLHRKSPLSPGFLSLSRFTTLMVP
jgi:hypothetical protein